MIRIISRSNIFEEKKIIKSEISKIQNIIYDHDELEFLKTDIQKNAYLAMFDCLFHHSTNIIHKEIILKPLQELNNELQIDSFALELCKLISSLNSDKFIIISHLKLDNTDFEIADSHPYIIDNHLYESDFFKVHNEAILADSNSIFEITKFIYLLSTTSANAPEYIYIFDYDEKFKINICNKGNIHFEALAANLLTEDTIQNINFEIIQKC